MLFRIDDRDYQARLAQTEANIAVARSAIANNAAEKELQQATIAQTEAQRQSVLASQVLADRNLERIQHLVETRATSLAQLDQMRAAKDQADAALLAATRSSLAYGIALFNIGRLAGGQIGTAVLQTLIYHDTVQNLNAFAADIANGQTTVIERLNQTTALLAGRGLEAGSITKAAISILGRQLTVQATAISFDDAFLSVALLFSGAVPILILYRIILAKWSGVKRDSPKTIPVEYASFEQKILKAMTFRLGRRALSGAYTILAGLRIESLQGVGNQHTSL